MPRLIESEFKKTAMGTYKVSKRNTPFIGFGLAFILMAIWFLTEQFPFDGDIITILGIAFVLATALLPAWLFLGLGLFTVTTEIDLGKRTARITKKDYRGRTASMDAPLDMIHVGATRMGLSDASVTEPWIVTAGFFQEEEDGRTSSTAIFSTETDSIEQRNEAMVELYRFFFPNQQAISSANIITDGNTAHLLSDEDAEKFRNGTLFPKAPADAVAKPKGKNWSKLLVD